MLVSHGELKGVWFERSEICKYFYNNIKLQTLNHDKKTLMLASGPLVLTHACVTKANLTQKIKILSFGKGRLYITNYKKYILYVI